MSCRGMLQTKTMCVCVFEVIVYGLRKPSYLCVCMFTCCSSACSDCDNRCVHVLCWFCFQDSLFDYHMELETKTTTHVGYPLSPRSRTITICHFMLEPFFMTNMFCISFAFIPVCMYSKHKTLCATFLEFLGEKTFLEFLGEKSIWCVFVFVFVSTQTELHAPKISNPLKLRGLLNFLHKFIRQHNFKHSNWRSVDGFKLFQVISCSIPMHNKEAVFW